MSSNKSQIQVLNLKSKFKRFAILFVVFIFGFSVISFKKVIAQSRIFINEFLIESQPQQVEIYNGGTETVDISGWIIDDSGGTTFYTIPQSSLINPGFCLIFSGDFNLNKTSADTIRLLNGESIIDSFSYKSSSGSGISFMRFPDGENNWATGTANLGKYNFRTEQACLFSALTPIITDLPTPITTVTATSQVQINPSETPNPTPFSYENIYISEVMVNPVSGNKEWVEIYNNNDFPVLLTNWYIDDIENGGSSPKTFSLEIPAKNYRSLNLLWSMFNNDNDSVRLLDFNKNLKDNFEYNSSIQGKTFGRISIDSDSFCLQDPSYETANNPCFNSKNNEISTHQITGRINPSPTTNFTPSKTTFVSRIINTPTISTNKDFKNGKVLGISTKTINKDFFLIRILSLISFSYSLLTIVAVLFKMKIIYGKIEKFFSTLIYTTRRK